MFNHCLILYGRSDGQGLIEWRRVSPWHDRHNLTLASSEICDYYYSAWDNFMGFDRAWTGFDLFSVIEAKNTTFLVFTEQNVAFCSSPLLAAKCCVVTTHECEVLRWMMENDELLFTLHVQFYEIDLR
ncbi:hypothetical protein Dimus_000110 [Dionaea muscipula]